MKSDCYPISPTCTPPPTSNQKESFNVECVDKKAKGFITQQTEASSPESIQDKQQPPSALLSPSSSSSSYTEEDDLNHRTKTNNQKVNGKVLPSTDHIVNDDHNNETDRNSNNQSVNNSKVDLKENQLSNVDNKTNGQLKSNGHLETNGQSKSNGHLESSDETKSKDEDSNEEINVDDEESLPSIRRDIKEENNEKNKNEETTNNQSPTSEEEEMFKQQFRNHFKKRHLIGDSSSKLVNALEKRENDSIDLTMKKPDYSTQCKSSNENLYSIYKHFYENYLNQHLNYMNESKCSEQPMDLKNRDNKPTDLKQIDSKQSDEPIDLKQNNIKRSNEFTGFNQSLTKSNGVDYSSLVNRPPFEPQLVGTCSVLNNLDNKYSAANLANQDTINTLESSRLKSMLYTGNLTTPTTKIPETSMDSLANYIQYYNGLSNGLNGFTHNALADSMFHKHLNATGEFIDYRKHSYGSLAPTSIKSNGLDLQSKNDTNSKLSNALKLPTDHLNKSLSKSLNNENLSNGQLKSPNQLLFNPLSNPLTNQLNGSQTSPPLNFLNYPRPPTGHHSMKPNSYHQFLCNLQQQTSKTDLSISNLNDTAAVGGALSNSRRKFVSFFLN